MKKLKKGDRPINDNKLEEMIVSLYDSKFDRVAMLTANQNDPALQAELALFEIEVAELRDINQFNKDLMPYLEANNLLNQMKELDGREGRMQQIRPTDGSNSIVDPELQAFVDSAAAEMKPFLRGRFLYGPGT